MVPTVAKASFSEKLSIVASIASIAALGISFTRWRRSVREREMGIGGVGESNDKVKSWLLNAVREHKHEPIWMVDVKMGDVTFQAARDAVRMKVDGRPLRVGCSYQDTITMCHLVGDLIAPSQKMCDAMYAQSNKLVYHSVPDLKMLDTVAGATWFNDDVEKQLATVGPGSPSCGAWKFWILDPRIGDRSTTDNGQPAAINYGGWNPAAKNKDPRKLKCSGVPCFQPAYGKHDWSHYDDAQLWQPVSRYGTQNGKRIDMLDWIEANQHYNGKYVTREQTAPFRVQVA